MSGLTPSQQAQAIANPQQQAILANDGRPAGHQQSNPASLLILKNQGVKLARDMMIKDTVMLTYLGLGEP